MTYDIKPEAFKTTAQVLIAIANQLSKKAKDSMPKIREGEEITREWYDNGIYVRETILNGQIFIAQYDFRKRKATQTLAGGETVA